MKYTYRVIRSSRKTVAIQITPEGEVLVRCPSRMKQADIQKFADSKSDWVQKHLAKVDPPLQPFTWEEIDALVRQARTVIPERAAYFAPLVGVSYERVAIRAQRSRWGSCSGKGNLNFNCLLMLAPPEVLDYVVVHELCHRRQMNHSEGFWAEVQRVLPDYQRQRKWLKDNGGALIGRLPK